MRIGQILGQNTQSETPLPPQQGPLTTTLPVQGQEASPSPSQRSPFQGQSLRMARPTDQRKSGQTGLFEPGNGLCSRKCNKNPQIIILSIIYS